MSNFFDGSLSKLHKTLRTLVAMETERKRHKENKNLHIRCVVSSSGRYQNHTTRDFFEGIDPIPGLLHFKLTYISNT